MSRSKDENLNGIRNSSRILSRHFRLDPQTQRKRQSRVFKRLFRYSRSDWKLITFGTFLLLGAALCK